MFDNLIQKWLKARQEWIVTLHQLCLYRPFLQTKDQASVLRALQECCEQLVDYVALGHFEVFEKMTAVTEVCRQPMAQIPQQILPSLMQSTLAVLAFNDKYQDDCSIFDLEADLSQLTQSMVQRFEIEDKLIKTYALAKTDYVSSLPKDFAYL